MLKHNIGLEERNMGGPVFFEWVRVGGGANQNLPLGALCRYVWGDGTGTQPRRCNTRGLLSDRIELKDEESLVFLGTWNEAGVEGMTKVRINCFGIFLTACGMMRVRLSEVEIHHSSLG